MADLPSTPADGNVKVAWVPAIAADAPTSTELTGAGVIDLSCYLTGDGWNPGLSENTISDDRLCSTQTFEQPGRHARSLDIKYIENPGSTTDNKAFDTLIPGTAGFLVLRRGTAFDTAFAADDLVDVWPVKCGQRAPQPPTADSPLTVSQKMFVTGKVREQATVAA